MMSKRAMRKEGYPDELDQLPLRRHDEHDALLGGLRQLEVALESLRPGPESDWRVRADFELRRAAASIERHCESAEGPDGLLAQVERHAGRSQNVSAAHRAHEQMCREVQALVSSLAQDVAIDVVRDRAAALAKLLHRHLNLIGDLAYDLALDSDTGVGD